MLVLGNTAGSELHIKVNRDVKYQEIFGFGGAFTDATGIMIKKLSPKLQEQLLRDYFSKDGIEYNMGRIPMGGSDYSARAYTYDDAGEDKTLSKFNLTQEDFEYKVNTMSKNYCLMILLNRSRLYSKQKLWPHMNLGFLVVPGLHPNG